MSALSIEHGNGRMVFSRGQTRQGDGPPPGRFMPAHQKTSRARRRGALLVEAALMLPLLMILTFAIFEYGWIYIKAQELRNAASTGARIGSLVPETEGESMTAKAQARVEAMLADYGIVGASVTYDPSSFDDMDRGDPVCVRITVPYDGADLQLIGFPLIPVPGTLSAEATFPKQ